jgi:hypothetical protein
LKTEKEKITAADVIAGLKIQFPAPAFCLLEQVADGTGARQHRWADAVAMSVWPSRGYTLHGIEVKVNRYDWLHEIQQPQKSAAVQKYCNHWWIAVSDSMIVQPGELPSTWGLTILNGKKMKVVTPAPYLEAEPWDIAFIASVFRNMAVSSTSEIETAVSKAYAKGHEEASSSSHSHLKSRIEELETSIREFQEKSGIEITRWNGDKIGEAVAVVMSMKQRINQVRDAAAACGEIHEALKKVVALAEMEEVFKFQTLENGG